MKKLLEKLRSLLQYEPALVAWLVNGGVATLLAFVLHLGATQTAAITTITTALAAVYTAIRARPVAVSVLTGALATIATATGAFGLHLPANVIAAVTAALSAVLALVFRQNLTPAATFRQLRADLDEAVARHRHVLVSPVTAESLARESMEVANPKRTIT